MVTLYIYQQTPKHHLTCHKSMPTTFTLKPSKTLRQAVLDDWHLRLLPGP